MAIEHFDSFLGFLNGRHGYKPKPSTLIRVPVENDLTETNKKLGFLLGISKKPKLTLIMLNQI